MLEKFKFTTMVDLVIARAEEMANNRAFTFLKNGKEELVISYVELDRSAKIIAAKLQGLKLAGQRAILLYSSPEEFIPAFFGCLYTGVLAVPVQLPSSRLNNLDGLNAIAEDAGVAAILSSEKKIHGFVNRFSEFNWSKNLPVVLTDRLNADLEKQWQYPSINEESLAFLQYTSGSTGIPKGVMVSHGNLLNNQEMIKQSFGNTETSRFVSWLPLYHDMGLIGTVMQPLYLGSEGVFITPMEFLQHPIRWLEAISKYKGVVSGGPNFAYDLCIRRISQEQKEQLNLSSWAIAFNGAERVSAMTMELFTKEFASCGFRKEAHYPTYGLAEATLFVTGGKRLGGYSALEVDRKKLETNCIHVDKSPRTLKQEIISCGSSLKEKQVLIVDPYKSVICGELEVGEVWISSPCVTKGYWNKPQLTAEIFGAEVKGRDHEKFLRTGDMGFIHRGELYITGRLKDLIIIRGKNYYPDDIEKSVRDCHPALGAAAGAAFSLEVCREEKLIILQEVNRAFIRKVDTKELISAIRQTISQNHNLQVYAVGLLKPRNIPLTSSGKIRRKQSCINFINNKFEMINSWQAGEDFTHRENANNIKKIPIEGYATGFLENAVMRSQ